MLSAAVPVDRSIRIQPRRRVGQGALGHNPANGVNAEELVFF